MIFLKEILHIINVTAHDTGFTSTKDEIANNFPWFSIFYDMQNMSKKLHSELNNTQMDNPNGTQPAIREPTGQGPQRSAKRQYLPTFSHIEEKPGEEELDLTDLQQMIRKAAKKDPKSPSSTD